MFFLKLLMRNFKIVKRLYHVVYMKYNVYQTDWSTCEQLNCPVHFKELFCNSLNDPYNLSYFNV